MPKPLTFKDEPYAGESSASLWLPEPDLVTHQLIGKLGEEAAELATICCRILIQGLDQSNPDDGKSNRTALVEEISDVMAVCALLQDKFGIDHDCERALRKYNLKAGWLDQLKEGERK